MNDLRMYSISAGTWTDLSNPASGSPPSPRDEHAMAASGDFLFVFGGWDSSGRVNDLRMYSISAGTWTDLSNPASGSPP
eukprot:CAMPEP_0181307350 /NCGR_PEP_ID=MMETSP1101-20121128/10828_1 /TAXON_ID=46948 /ORGANISM="Rhodomonas abbreviata, Strain Caron Lab Isolate" /LENGTH=78 /DNA_ID=CAMNT_0023413551 /DNA_START=463 /DNA_END=695 /DNA_ORIENTATION=+